MGPDEATPRDAEPGTENRGVRTGHGELRTESRTRKSGHGEPGTESRARRTGHGEPGSESGGVKSRNQSCGVQSRDRGCERASGLLLTARTAGWRQSRLNERSGMAPLVCGSELYCSSLQYSSVHWAMHNCVCPNIKAIVFF